MPSRNELVQAIRNQLVLPANGDDRIDNGWIYFRMNQVRAALIKADYEEQYQRYGLAAKYDYDPSVYSYPIKLSVYMKDGFPTVKLPSETIDFPTDHGIQDLYFENPNNLKQEAIPLAQLVKAQMRTWFYSKRAVRFGDELRFYGVPKSIQNVYAVIASDLTQDEIEEGDDVFFDWKAQYRIPSHLTHKLIEETVRAIQRVINGPKDELNDGNPINSMS